jgi:hypothetical protein
MWKHPDGTYKITPPARVELAGYVYPFAALDTAQLDAAGYNEAIPIKREPYTTYTTEWVKGEDLIYREEVVTAVVDEAARDEAAATAVRAERDRLLRASDWTQVADAPVDQEAWALYRQALRDVPEQAGFPGAVEWPAMTE